MVAWSERGLAPSPAVAGPAADRSRSAGSSGPRARSRPSAGCGAPRAVRVRRPRRLRGRPLLPRGSGLARGGARRRRARLSGSEGVAAARLLPFRVHADLRVQVPERAPARGVPRHERAGAREMRGVRRLPARARPPSGRGPLQGLGLLLDRLRPRRPEGRQGLGLVRLGLAPASGSSGSGSSAARRAPRATRSAAAAAGRLRRARRARRATDLRSSGCPVRQPGP